jgi:hypothetical protein
MTTVRTSKVSGIPWQWLFSAWPSRFWHSSVLFTAMEKHHQFWSMYDEGEFSSLYTQIARKVLTAIRGRGWGKGAKSEPIAKRLQKLYFKGHIATHRMCKMEWWKTTAFSGGEKWKYTNAWDTRQHVSWKWSATGVYGWQPCHHLWAVCLDNVGSSTPHNPIGLHGLLRRKLYFTLLYFIRMLIQQERIHTKLCSSAFTAPEEMQKTAWAEITRNCPCINNKWE